MITSQSHSWPTFIVLALAFAGLGCDSEPAPPGDDGPTLTPGQLNGTWVRIAPPEDTALGDLERVVQTPDGFVALYRRSLGESKVMEGWESRLLRSVDGLQWSEQDLLITDENRFLQVEETGRCWTEKVANFKLFFRYFFPPQKTLRIHWGK